MARGFQCKQFFIAHDLCAMKVNTDSLILGSWATSKGAQQILDVGCGSGILSLMMCQRSADDAQVLAIDIAQDAIVQTRINADNSPWSDRIQVRHCGLAALTPSQPIDTIICNPPYFSDTNVGNAAHLAQSASRQAARHQGCLSSQDLFMHATNVTSSTARLACLYPTSQRDIIIAHATQHDWQLDRELTVFNKQGGRSHVSAFEFSKQHGRRRKETLIIRDEKNSYTDHYKALCKDFYLAF
ncbi:methyltransferase [Salinimonas sp. HHU 13199]|uniref:Methyltransferase n=1 Tax=Salinimonas profundi TaxID=2729140 RepID=A0ABR8LNK4_9ALTE|nr:methyltransferase [Salinimonas profundi]MBD3586963.1 methyltransferase [Salinimonas profundi]